MDSGNAEHTGFYKLDSGNIVLDEPAIPPRKEGMCKSSFSSK